MGAQCTPYLLENPHKNACASTHDRITSAIRCKTAANNLGYSYNQNESSETYPAGCYLHAGESVWFNAHEMGGAQAGSSPICALKPNPYMDHRNTNECSGGHRITSEAECKASA